MRDECPTVKTLLQADGEALEEAVQYGSLMQGFNGTPDFRYEGATTLSSDPAFIFFTSGTTGFPKMVVHNHLYSNGKSLLCKYCAVANKIPQVTLQQADFGSHWGQERCTGP